MRCIAALLIVTVLFSVGCATYEAPLVKEHVIPVDSSVLGLWEGGESDRMVILKYSDTEYLIHYPVGGTDEAYYRGYPIKIGGLSCVQLERIGTAEDGTYKEKARFDVYSYELKDGILEARSLSTRLVDDDLKTTEALVQAFLKHKDNKDLFTNPVRFKLVKQARDDNSLKMEFVWCPPGEFTMGSADGDKDEKPVSVTLTAGFWLGNTEVTQGQWKTMMGTTPWEGKDYVKEGSDYPAVHVSWTDAMSFCEKLTKQERSAGRLPRDWEYTLPTEAQWEYACRAGTRTKYSFGDDADELGGYSWFGDNAYDIGEKYAHEVGNQLPNAWKLHEMHGNVSEWCRDWYTKNLPGGDNPEVATKGSIRVFRGGSWWDGAGLCRSAYRDGDGPGYRNGDLGFRVARSSVSK